MTLLMGGCHLGVEGRPAGMGRRDMVVVVATPVKKIGAPSGITVNIILGGVLIITKIAVDFFGGGGGSSICACPLSFDPLFETRH